MTFLVHNRRSTKYKHLRSAYQKQHLCALIIETAKNLMHMAKYLNITNCLLGTDNSAYCVVYLRLLCTDKFVSVH